MTWEPQRSAGHEGVRALLVPSALGVTIGTLVHLLGFVIVTEIVIASTDPGEQLAGSRVLGIAVAAAGSLALACAMAARTCSRRGSARRVEPRMLRRTSLVLGLSFGCVVLLLGLTLALRWTTLPIYLVAVVLGSAVGARTAR
jgi:hypothetical protein